MIDGSLRLSWIYLQDHSVVRSSALSKSYPGRPNGAVFFLLLLAIFLAVGPAWATTFTLTPAEQTVKENSGSVSFTIEATNLDDLLDFGVGYVEVDFATKSGSAQAGRDFEAKSSFCSFGYTCVEGGEGGLSCDWLGCPPIVITLINDDVFEHTESFELEITSVTAYAYPTGPEVPGAVGAIDIENSPAEVLIRDDDLAPLRLTGPQRITGLPGSTRDVEYTIQGDGGPFDITVNDGLVSPDSMPSKGLFTYSVLLDQSKTNTISVIDKGNNYRIYFAVDIRPDLVITPTEALFIAAPGTTVTKAIAVTGGVAPIISDAVLGSVSPASLSGQGTMTYSYTVPATATPGQVLQDTITFADSEDQSQEAVVSITVCDPLELSGPTVINGPSDSTQSATYTISGGLGPFEISVDEGSVSPASLSSQGSFLYSVQLNECKSATLTVQDTSCGTTAELVVLIRPDLEVSPSSYTTSLKAGETASVVFEVTGAVPPVSLTTQRGTVSPATLDGQCSTTYTCTVPPSTAAGEALEDRVTFSDSEGRSIDVLVTMNVVEQSSVLDLSVLSLTGVVTPGGSSSWNVSLSGGTPPYSISLLSDDDADGSVAPPELSQAGAFSYSFLVPEETAVGTSFKDTIRIRDAEGEIFDIPVNIYTSTIEGLEGLTDNEKSVAEALTAAFIALSDLQAMGIELTAAQNDLYALALELLGSTELDPDAVIKALGEITPLEAGVASDIATQMAGVQLANINKRLASLRNGNQKGVDVSNLRIHLADASIPGSFTDSLLAAAVVDDAGTGLYEAEPLLGGRLGIFINGNLVFGDRDGDSEREGYDFSTGGVTAGADYKFTRNLVMGVSFGYAATIADYDDDGDLDVDSYTLSLYGNWYPVDELYLDGIVSYGWTDYDAERNISYTVIDPVDRDVKSDFEGNQLSLGLGAGYNFLYQGFTFGPVGRVTYVRTTIDGYEEEASSSDPAMHGLDLKFDDQEAESLTTTLGIRVDYVLNTRFGVVVPKLELDWEHEHADAGDDIGAYFVNDPSKTSFTIDADEPDRDYFLISPGVSFVFPGGINAFFNYEYTADRDDLSQHRFDAGFRWEFE